MRYLLLLTCLLNISAIAQNWQKTEAGLYIIGEMVWNNTPLVVTKYRNGDAIEYADSDDKWKEFNKKGIGAFCYMNDDKSNGNNGILYNWFAVTDPRGLAPEGWHIPSLKEVNQLDRNVRYPFLSAEGTGSRETDGTYHESLNYWYFDPLFPRQHHSMSDCCVGSQLCDDGKSDCKTSTGYLVLCVNDLNQDEYNRWLKAKNKGNEDKQHEIEKEAKERRSKISEANMASYRAITDSLEERDAQIKLLQEEANWGKETSSIQIGNDTYPTAVIGRQEWMTANLAVKEFRNGDEIPYIESDQEWVKAAANKRPGWCYYEGDPSKGVMYNYYAVIDPRGIAPEGWRVPTAADCDELVRVLDVTAFESKAIRSKKGWSKKGTNESGFSAVPGGIRFSDEGGFMNIEQSVSYWTTTAEGNGSMINVLEIEDNSAYLTQENKGSGLSLRLIKE